jgi:hypothetical protein
MVHGPPGSRGSLIVTILRGVDSTLPAVESVESTGLESRLGSTCVVRAGPTSVQKVMIPSLYPRPPMRYYHCERYRMTIVLATLQPQYGWYCNMFSPEVSTAESLYALWG